ncbi:MAG: 4a-hydroxytetrahydrobiopterin dehydratase [Pseudomonadota bacterium]
MAFDIYEGEKLTNWLSDHGDWKEEGGEIVLKKKFSDFVAAFGFLSQVAVLAEKHNHHPRIENTYNNVTLAMHTHDAGNKITDKDIALAEAIEKIL